MKITIAYVSVVQISNRTFFDSWPLWFGFVGKSFFHATIPMMRVATPAKAAPYIVRGEGGEYVVPLALSGTKACWTVSRGAPAGTVVLKGLSGLFEL